MAAELKGKFSATPPRSASAADCHSGRHGLGLTPLALPALGARSDSPPGASPCPQPPGLLPRNVAPPTAGGSCSSTGMPGMEAMWDARYSRQPCLGSTRMSEPGGSGLGFQHPQELPPLRDNPALSPISHGTDILGASLRSDLKTPGGRVSMRATNIRGRLSQLGERSESSASVRDECISAHEVEHLKRQVTRLTQLRRDRDNYIQDLLAEAEGTQKRHEAEIARRTARSQREASERLAAQQREHDLHLGERSRAHAAALAQQAWQHEREIEELRKSLRIDSERKLAERMAEAANHHRDLLKRLQHGIDELRQRVASQSLLLGDVKDELRPNPLSSSTDTAAEPEPEEAALENGAVGLDPQDAVAAEALAERQATEAAESVERALALFRKDLESTLKAGKMLTKHSSIRPEDSLDSVQFEQKIKDSASRVDIEKRNLVRKTKDYAAVAATAASQTLLLKVLLTWNNEVRRLRSLEAEKQRVIHKRQQRQPLILARIQADVDQWLHIVFRAWVSTKSSSSREVADQKLLEQRDQEVVSGRRKLRANVLSTTAIEALWLLQVCIHTWKDERRQAQDEASHRHSLHEVQAAAAAEQASIRGEASRAVLTLRLKWRSRGMENIRFALEHTERAALLAWAAVAQAARATHATERHLEFQSKELGESRRTQGLVVAQAAIERSQLVAFHAWTIVRLMAKWEADSAHRLEAAAADAAKTKSAMELATKDLNARLSGECRTQGLRLGRAHTGFQKRIMLLRWAVATREARKEAAHRRQLITAAADASADVYKLRAEGKKVAVELRKQRRAHGVAAIHANLDRRLQSVLLAWGSVVRDGQREAAYQRQLDIAAAESAAGCAVLRMEGRRAILELREERCTQALRAIDAGLRFWQHTTFREWWALTAATRQQAHFAEALQAHATEVAMHEADVEARHRSELREQADDCEARISCSRSAAHGSEASVEAQATEVARLTAEREALQAQIEKLHDELRHHHCQS